MSFIPHTSEDLRTMLEYIGVADVEELIREIPSCIRLSEQWNIPSGISELEVIRELEGLADENILPNEGMCFMGGGAYQHFIPAAVDHLVSRPEFYTAYTPYQAEVSQGTLQVIYEFQSLLSSLTGMEVVNASMYDGASATAEAALLACSVTRRSRIILAGTINPLYERVIQTYCSGQDIAIESTRCKDGGIDIEHLKDILTDRSAGVIVQHPNFFGCLEDVIPLSESVHSIGAFLIIVADPLSLGILKPPGEFGADIMTGEGQSLGNVISFGGPYLGLFATSKKLVRKVPGRLAGRTIDTQGKEGFVLVLQTREQHIRREKATSNICTNQALNALAACVYLVLLGPEGIKTAATQCLKKSHYLAERISSLPGYSLQFSRPFFKEFVIETPVEAKVIQEKLLKHRIFPGIELSLYGMPQSLLVSVTEIHSRKNLDDLVSALKEIS